MNLKLKLHIRNYNGGPGIRIYWDKQKLFDQILVDKGPCQLNLQLPNFNLPNTLAIEMYNKNMKYDTLLDKDKNIIDDKACYISEVSFGDISLTQELFLFEFEKELGDVSSNNVYLGFNGTYKIDITDKNIHQWYNGLQQHLISNSEQFDYDKFKTEIFGINNFKYSIKY